MFNAVSRAGVSDDPASDSKSWLTATNQDCEIAPHKTLQKQ